MDPGQQSMSEDPKSPEIPCPICRKVGTWFKFPHGPFCSPRCKTIDLGKWLGEEYRFSEPLDDEGWDNLPSDDDPDHGPNPL